MTAPGEPPKYPIESVDNALRLITAFTEHRTLGVSDASELLGVAPSTAHRLLAMLVYRGFIQQHHARDHYEAGPAMLGLARAVLRSVDLRSLARRPVEELVAEIGETTHVQVLQGTNVLFVDCLEGRYALRAGSRIGQALPAHCTAGGKAIMSTMSDERIRDLYRDTNDLMSLTAKSITDIETLLETMQQTRDRGFALNMGEAEDHLNAVAVGIRPDSHSAWAAVTVAAPSHRLPEERAVDIAPAVIRAAASIAEGII